MSYVWALLGFCALIILHEGGHFAAAKAVGMRVEKFSLFFGPMIVRKTIGETVYGIGTIPLGGYVKITGMSPEEVFEEPSVEARAYVNQPVWKRIVVILAGPVVNLIVAFVILWAVLLHDGISSYGPQKLAAITTNSAAAAVIPKGSELISVNGETNAKAIQTAVEAARCKGAQTNGCVASPAIAVTVKDKGKLHTYQVHPRYSAKLKRPLVGVEFQPEILHRNLGIVAAAGHSVSTMGQEIGRTASVLGRIWQAKERRQIQGVVGIYAATQEAVSYGTSVLLSVLAAVSLGLGIINLLPILPLDGGHIFWALVEKVRKRRASLATMERASWAGLAIVMVLFAIGLSNSITTLSHGGTFLK